MAASGEVSIDNRVHPYLVAIVRWCISCIWSTATVLLQRLMTSSLPLPPIPRKSSSKPFKPRPASKDHLDPEPRVECVVLHQPDTHDLDVVFVHGLYGSLGNTWRQGEWRSKYPVDPERIHLRRPTSIPTPCNCPSCNEKTNNDSNENNEKQETKCIQNEFNENTINDSYNDNDCTNIDDKKFRNIDESFINNIRKIIPEDDVFITEKFYNNTLLNQVEIVDNYETQANFVRDLFKHCDEQNRNENDKENMFNDFNDNQNDNNENGGNENCFNEVFETECKCKVNEKQCEVGCGCICDECYSPCWPRDWIKEDYPNARVISINYTSDPHLWRPLWIRESKRLKLHERAEQMMQQLLELGVGQRPIVWVGHSKGGLFIKQIYCEAYEAYQKVNKTPEMQKNEEQMKECDQENKMNNIKDIANNNRINDAFNEKVFIDDENRVNDNESVNMKENDFVFNEKKKKDGETFMSLNGEDLSSLQQRASLWSNSIAFMFYSVPHRGSPLADIKTPVTARSIELLEIAKDCALVRTLHARWLSAAEGASGVGGAKGALVRSLVETRRTLMAVLWLTIVSFDSADPGIGALCGISVDHREICKPTSRHCPLYVELKKLIQAALNQQQIA